jgi:hypothetical protein
MAQNRPTDQVVAAVRHLLPLMEWTIKRSNYELVTSQYVLDEAADSDPAVADREAGCGTHGKWMSITGTCSGDA